MEISGKVLREVEFRDRLRGYDTDEVDEFLEKVAVGVDDLRAELEALARRAERAERRAEEVAVAPARPTPAAPPPPDDDSIRRTLVLAQRTADMAIAEAREEATRLLEEARSESEAILARAEESARRLRDDAEQELHVRIGRLAEERERLERDVHGLTRLVETERARLTESLSGALRVVSEGLSLSDELAEQRASLAEAPEPVFPTAPPPAARELSPAPLAQEGPSPEEAVEQQPLVQGGGPEQPEEPASPTARMRPAEREEPDVESEIAQDAAAAYGGPPRRPATSTVRVLPSSEDPDEELWERWAAGRDLGVVPGPEDFSRESQGRRGRGPGTFSA